MSEIFNKLAIAQFNLLATQALKAEKSEIELPANLADLMYKTLCENSGETVQKVSVRDILSMEIPLPFMPNRIDYKIGKGCCDEIIKRDGLFVPCSHPTDCSPKCSKHNKERSGCGDYWARHQAWQNKELYCVVIGEKELKEKPYGSYLHSKKLDSTAVEDELWKWGIELRLDHELFRMPNKPVKKNRGRKTELKVEAADSDEESEKSSEKESDPDEPKSDDESESKEEPEPKEEPEEKSKEEKPKKAPPKPRSKKALGTPLDGQEGELVKEEMEKAPKKGKFKGKAENMKEVEHDGTTYKTYAGKYYDADTLELVAWTNKGEFTLL